MMFALLLCVLTSTVLRSSTHLTALASGRATLSQTIAVMAPCDMSSSVRRLIPLSIQQACLACWRSLNSATPASAAAVVADKVEPEVEISAPIAEIVKDHTPAVIELTEANDANTSIAVDEVVMESSSPASDPISELIEVESSFINLLCLSACAVALAHGSNDVSNAVAPFAAILKSYQKHIGALQSQSSALGAGDTPFWVLICGGVGICIGLATYGWRVRFFYPLSFTFCFIAFQTLIHSSLIRSWRRLARRLPNCRIRAASLHRCLPPFWCWALLLWVSVYRPLKCWLVVSLVSR
jgi:phosphate/sulfate permease